MRAVVVIAIEHKRALGDPVGDMVAPSPTCRRQKVGFDSLVEEAGLGQPAICRSLAESLHRTPCQECSHQRQCRRQNQNVFGLHGGVVSRNTSSCTSMCLYSNTAHCIWRPGTRSLYCINENQGFFVARHLGQSKEKISTCFCLVGFTSLCYHDNHLCILWTPFYGSSSALEMERVFFLCTFHNSFSSL